MGSLHLELAALAVLPVRRYSESDYMSHVSEARKYLQHPDDVQLAALALKLRLPSATTVYTSARLLKALGVPSK